MLIKGIYLCIYMEKGGMKDFGKEEQRKINELIKGVKTINKIMGSLNIPEGILEKDIKPFGNASHIILSKEHTNKKAKIIIKK